MTTASADARPSLQVHATTVALGPAAAVVLRGPSGSGKSDLALRFLSGQSHVVGLPPDRFLIADDQTCLNLSDGRLEASAQAGFAGLIEVRGLGIARMPHLPAAEVRLVVDIVPAASVERYPLEPATVQWLGVQIPLRRLAAFDASTPLKLVLALAGMINAPHLSSGRDN